MAQHPDDPRSSVPTRGTLAPVTLPEDGVPRPAGRRTLTPGDRLGRWRLDRIIGEGATATVWAARHTELGSPVAIKVFHRRGLGFHQVMGEARAAAGIPSPNVIWVYDVDTFDGHHAIVMELAARGDDLASSLRDRGITDATWAARWIAQAARGVAAAHAGGVFHKDVKPANILIHPLDARAQITDFGLANPLLWRADGRHAHEAQTTVAVEDAPTAAIPAADPFAAIRGTLRVGTPEFMAPEQAAGLRRDLDPQNPVHRRHLVAIDVWGLGASLYALLSGHPPYPHGPTAGAEATPLEVMNQVVTEAPIPLRHLAPEVPRRLARIAEKAMSRLPTQRHSSAEELAFDLEQWLADRPTSIDRSWWQRAGVHLYRERARGGLIAALALVTLISTWVVWRNDQHIADQQAQIATSRAELRVLEDSRARLSDMLQSTREALSATRDALVQKDVQLGAQEYALERAIGQVDDLSASLDDRAMALEHTTEELGAASTRIAHLEAVVSATQAQLDATREDLAATSAILASTEIDLATAQSGLVEELAHHADLEQTAADLVGELASTRHQLDTLTVRSADLERERDALTATVRRVTEKLQRLELAALSQPAEAPEVVPGTLSPQD